LVSLTEEEGRKTSLAFHNSRQNAVGNCILCTKESSSTLDVEISVRGIISPILNVWHSDSLSSSEEGKVLRGTGRDVLEVKASASSLCKSFLDLIESLITADKSARAAARLECNYKSLPLN